MKCKLCGSEENVKEGICCKCFLDVQRHSWAEWHALKGEASIPVKDEQLELMKEFVKNPPKKKANSKGKKTSPNGQDS